MILRIKTFFLDLERQYIDINSCEGMNLKSLILVLIPDPVNWYAVILWATLLMIFDVSIYSLIYKCYFFGKRFHKAKLSILALQNPSFHGGTTTVSRSGFDVAHVPGHTLVYFVCRLASPDSELCLSPSQKKTKYNQKN